MLVVMVVHDVKPGRLDQARRRIDGNSDQMAKQSGLLFRHTGFADGLDNRIVTITAWQCADDRHAWDAVKRTLPVEADPKDIFDQVRSFTVTTYDERWHSELTALGSG